MVLARGTGDIRVLVLIVGDETMQLEGLGVVDLLRLGGRSGPAVHVRFAGVGTGRGSTALVFRVGPGVSGVDVEEDIDDCVELLVSDTELEGLFGTYRGRG